MEQPIFTSARKKESGIKPLSLSEALLEACWDVYRAAGMPYGESDDGMTRWLREVGKINRLRMEAERLEEHHWGMAAFRRMVEEKRIAHRE